MGSVPSSKEGICKGPERKEFISVMEPKEAKYAWNVSNNRKNGEKWA